MKTYVTTGRYPSKLKHAQVILIFKGGDEKDSSKYRPISLLSLFNRLLEKVMYNRLNLTLNQMDFCTRVSMVFVRICQLSVQLWMSLIRLKEIWINYSLVVFSWTLTRRSVSVNWVAWVVLCRRGNWIFPGEMLAGSIRNNKETSVGIQ